jgi:hypothetical protein
MEQGPFTAASAVVMVRKEVKRMDWREGIVGLRLGSEDEVRLI